MPSIVEVESTLTDRYQTTVPETVRRALGLNKRDKIHYSIRPDGEVVLTRATPEDVDDPVLGAFLALLERDISAHPERVSPLDSELLAAMQQSASEIGEIDLDAPLREDEE